MTYNKYVSNRAIMPAASGTGNGTRLPVVISASGKTDAIVWNLDEKKDPSLDLLWTLKLKYIVPKVSIVCAKVVPKVHERGIQKFRPEVLIFNPEQIIIPSAISMEMAVSEVSTKLVLLEEPPLGVYYAHFGVSYSRKEEDRFFEIIHKMQFLRPSLARK